MDNNLYFQSAKLVFENIWGVLALLVFLTVLLRWRAIKEELPKYVSRLKIGDVEVELREVKKDLAETKEQVAVLENDLEQERSRFHDIAEDFDIHAPVAELEKVRSALKAEAPNMDDLTPVFDGLKEGASAAQLYAAAEVVRARRDPRFFDDLVACLARLAADANLQGIRLHTVWTLTSALHRTLIAEIEHHAVPNLKPDQLRAAQRMLDTLVRNPRVLQDRPDAPMKGVRGPAKWAGDWIAKGLKKLQSSEGD